MVRAPPDLNALLARIDDLVRVHRAVPRADLRVLKRHLPAIAPRLVERGYEIGSSIRLPLDQQVLELLAHGFVLKKGLERKVAGASAREVLEAVRRLVQRGSAIEVVRESGAGLVSATSEVVAASELDELLRCLVRVEKLVRRARAAKAVQSTILRVDVVGPLKQFLDADTEPSPRTENALVDALSREIRKRFGESPLPIRVPDLLRSMGASAEEGKHALVQGASRGLFELEPESGMDRLPQDDAEFCPDGPMGTRLSWVVVRQQKGLH